MANKPKIKKEEGKKRRMYGGIEGKKNKLSKKKEEAVNISEQGDSSLGPQGSLDNQVNALGIMLHCAEGGGMCQRCISVQQ